MKTDPYDQRLNFRMVVEARATPIHLIRFNEKQDGTAKLTMARLNKGHGMQGPHKFVKRWHRTIGQDQTQAFKKLIADIDFWTLTRHDLFMTWEEDALCMHASYFKFDAVQGKRAYDYAFSNCMLVTEGLQMMKALYDLAEITEDDDWSMAEYFSDVWEKPQFENLLTLD